MEINNEPPTNPIFSVIIPTYNRSAVIGRAINSVLAQTFKDFELIIADDGSTDDTEMIIKQNFQDSRIKYLKLEHGGAQRARNGGLKIAKGEYVSFLDSDDEWNPIFLQKHLDRYKTDEQISVVYCLTGVKNSSGLIIAARNDNLEGGAVDNSIHKLLNKAI